MCDWVVYDTTERNTKEPATTTEGSKKLYDLPVLLLPPPAQQHRREESEMERNSLSLLLYARTILYVKSFNNLKCVMHIFSL